MRGAGYWKIKEKGATTGKDCWYGKMISNNWPFRCSHRAGASHLAFSTSPTVRSTVGIKGPPTSTSPLPNQPECSVPLGGWGGGAPGRRGRQAHPQFCCKRESCYGDILRGEVTQCDTLFEAAGRRAAPRRFLGVRRRPAGGSCCGHILQDSAGSGVARPTLHTGLVHPTGFDLFTG